VPDKFGDTFPLLLVTHGSLLVVGGRTKQTTQSLA
jgi:hypothetical protein